MQSHRLSSGGLIDRHRELSFTFNGRPLVGYQGDTVASALVANNVRAVGRSIKYHRPRGIVGSWCEEPNALLQIGSGSRTLPNQKATQVELYDGLLARSLNSWPSLNFDLMAINGKISPFLTPGFYYKTFKWPASFWKTYEHVLRSASGFGSAPTERDTDRYEKRNAHCDVLVIGGGPAGIAAALESGRAGARVTLVDDQPLLGGRLLDGFESIHGDAVSGWLTLSLNELRSLPSVRLLSRSTAFGYYDHNFVGVVERVSDHLLDSASLSPKQRLWRIRATAVVIATGAFERPLVFHDNDRPGIMTASAVLAYVKRYAAIPGRKVVVFTNNDSAYRTALALVECGATVTIVDARPNSTGDLPSRARKLGLEIANNSVVTGTRGSAHVEAVEIAALGDRGVTSQIRQVECDLVALSGGWSPALDMHCQSGGRAQYDPTKACFVPGQSQQNERSAGSCKGSFTLSECINEGAAAGLHAVQEAGGAAGKATLRPPRIDEPREQPIIPMWIVPSKYPLGRGPKQFVDFQNDTSAADIAMAARENFQSIEHIKRYTLLGFGTDQGKLSNVNGIGILSIILNKDMSAIGTTTFRPAYTPVMFGTLAGRDIGNLADPVRKTPMHEWHQKAGCEFENVGQWKRPWYYPKNGESLHEAVLRECAATQRGVGVLDASTLGKIDVRGPDAAEFLNRIYTNDRSKLAIGKCSYGLMLGEDGMVFDDGIAARLGDDHFFLTTTSGGAARVMAWMERWLQTEWPTSRVYLTSVTDQFAAISINGPKSRDLVGELTEGLDVSNAAFPFMSFRDATFAGVPARVFRISFSGELAYEVYVPANQARMVWDKTFVLQTKYGITPYGTETMHVLRADKGYIIVGQDTDGSLTPADVGMNWAVNKNKDCLGFRSLSRSDTVRSGRKQLVGLLTENPTEVLVEGGQIVNQPVFSIPVPMLGHVTSSYMSARVGRSIALAVIKGGLDRIGEVVYIASSGRATVKATIVKPVFYDPEGKLQNV